ncbi:MAG: efflux RND transporter permease subunit [Planctomycetota bacterium]|nr:efflux RND transporter permease subunit [Planctomycetota bacterium]
MDHLASLLIQHRRLVWSGILCLTGLAFYGLLYHPSPQAPGGQQESDALQTSGASFDLPQPDALLVIEVENLFEPQTVIALRSMAAAVEQLDYVATLNWIDRIPVLNTFGLEDPLLPPNDASPERFVLARQKVLQHPVIVGQLISADGRTLLMPVTFDWLAITDDADCTEQLLRVARAATGGGDESIRVSLTGPVPLFLEHDDAFHHNRRKFQLIAYSLVIAISLFLFRKLSTVLIVSAGPLLGVFWTWGILNWMQALSNPLTTVVLPVLLTMIGMTDGLHLMVHIRRLRNEGATPLQAAQLSIQRVGTACLLTSVTTAIGFASLLLAHNEFVQGFGRSCAIGAILTLVAVLTVIPLASVTRLGRFVHHGHGHRLVDQGLQKLTWLVDSLIHRPRQISLLGILLTLALAAVCSTLRPDNRTRDAQPTGSPAYAALAHCDRELGGIELVHVVMRWPDSIPHDSAQIMQTLLAVEALIDREKPLLQCPLSIRNLLDSIPANTPLEQQMPLLNLLPESILQPYYDATARKARITVRISDLGIARYEIVFRRLEKDFEQLATQYPGFQFSLEGEPVERGRALQQIVTDLAASLGTASVIILIVMTVVYRSLRIGLITIVPNLFPLAVTGSMLVVMDWPLNVASVCSFVVCLGIAVDDTIHFLTRYGYERTEGQSTPAAIRRAFVHVGTALILTTLILVAGFSTVLTSDLAIQRSFAAMACSTILAALVGDLIFLPAMLMWWDHEQPGPVDS